MSGGVDSSVCAAILKKDGYEVVGIFMRMHAKSNPKDAKIVAQKLKIPFRVLDLRKEFKKKVIDHFIKKCEKGNTPNPCVECNPQIKFKFLFKELKKQKADYIATGHYARIKPKFQNLKSEIQNYQLLSAKDKNKDQSYFLWQLNQKQLAKIIFPLGEFTKERVREVASKFKLLPLFTKKESQDICFTLPRQIFKARPGPILDVDNKKIGKHQGLVFYTIGQRKGIKIGGTGPYYVVRKNFKKNALIVSNLDKDLLQKEMIIKDVNWLNKPKKIPFKCGVKIRSTAQIVPCRISKNQDSMRTGRQSKLKIQFNKPQRAVTPGQSAVFYKGDELLGGGVIEK